MNKFLICGGHWEKGGRGAELRDVVRERRERCNRNQCERQPAPSGGAAKAAMSTMNGAKWSAYRRFRFQSHYVFYTQEPDHILIRALIHVRQDLRPSLFE